MTHDPTHEPLPDPGDVYALRRYNDYLVEFVEVMTGYRMRMSHTGLCYADRVRAPSSAEEKAGVLRTLQVYGGPGAMVDLIRKQTLIAENVAAQEAARI